MVSKAGEAGFEPAINGSKVRRLTTWPLPKNSGDIFLRFYAPDYTITCSSKQSFAWHGAICRVHAKVVIEFWIRCEKHSLLTDYVVPLTTFACTPICPRFTSYYFPIIRSTGPARWCTSCSCFRLESAYILTATAKFQVRQIS